MSSDRPRTAREFQAMFASIYGVINRKYRTGYLIMHLSGETSRLLRAVRKEDYQIGVPAALARIYAWSNAIASRFQIDFQDALWMKFPGVCSYCLKESDCECGPSHPKVEDKETHQRVLRMRQLNRDGREPKDLLGHQMMHRWLYYCRAVAALPIELALHVAEEVGEVNLAFFSRDPQEIASELADVTAWSFTLASRLEIDFADALWKQFPNVCAWCKNNRCNCLVRISCSE